MTASSIPSDICLSHHAILLQQQLLIPHRFETSAVQQTNALFIADLPTDAQSPSRFALGSRDAPRVVNEAFPSRRDGFVQVVKSSR